MRAIDRHRPEISLSTPCETTTASGLWSEGRESRTEAETVRKKEIG